MKIKLCMFVLNFQMPLHIHDWICENEELLLLGANNSIALIATQWDMYSLVCIVCVCVCVCVSYVLYILIIAHKLNTTRDLYRICFFLLLLFVVDLYVFITVCCNL